MIEEPQQPLDKKQVAAMLRKELPDIFDRLVKEDDAERLSAVNKARRNLKFYRGDQFIAPGFDSKGAVDFESVAAGVDGDSTMHAVNTIRGDGKKYVAVTSVRAPNVHAVPEDADDPESVEAARMAGIELRAQFRQMDIIGIVREAAETQWCSGPQFALTEYVSDGARYGFAEEPAIEERERVLQPASYNCPACGASNTATAWSGSGDIQCDQCGGVKQFQPEVLGSAAVETGTKRYPKGDVETTLYNILYVTIPMNTKSIEKTDWLRLEYMESTGRILSIFREQLKEYRDSLEDGSSTSGAQGEALDAIFEVVSPSVSAGVPTSGFTQFARWWIRPYVYEMFTDSRLRAACYEIFPAGMEVPVVAGRHVMEPRPEKMDDLWNACKSGSGAQIMADPLCDDSIPFQKALNDLVNLALEIVLRAIPKTFVDNQLLDRETLKKNRAIVGEIILTKFAGQDLSKMIGKLPTSEISPQLMGLLQAMRSLDQDNNGIRPEIYGGGQAAPTFRQEKLRKDSAMAQLQPPYEEIQRFCERIAKNAVVQSARYGSGVRMAPSQAGIFSGTDRVERRELSEGKWMAQVDEGFPLTHAEEAAMLHDLLTTLSPEAQAKLGLLDAPNIPRVNALLNPISGFRAPVESEVRKVESIVRQLIQEDPIRNIDPMTGQMTFECSLPPDDFTDDHALDAEIVRMWCNSDAGLQLKKSAPLRFENVKARGKAHLAIAEQMAMEAAMAGAPPPPAPDQPSPVGPPPVPETFDVGGGANQPIPPAGPEPLGSPTIQ